jgi:hypothetical protein
MKPGFTNFMRVRKGDVLATDVRGEVRAPRTGRVFMPLYQAQGDDGFFIVKRVSSVFWKASTVARWLKLRRFVGALPGVRKVPRADSFVVDTRLARFLRRQLFATLGYRRTKEVGACVVFSKNDVDHDAGIAFASSLGS